MKSWILVALAASLPLAGCIEPGDPTRGADVDADLEAIALPDKLAWRNLAAQETPRAEHMAAVWDGKIYSIGGYWLFNNIDGIALGGAAVTQIASMEIYDIATDTWTQGPDYPVNVNHAIAVAWDGFVYVFAGGNSHRFNIDANRWEAIAAPPANHNAGTGAVDPDTGLIYVAIGRTTEFHRYDPATDTYEELAETPLRRDHTSGAFVRGKFYVGPGDVSGHSENTAATHEYDPATNTWTERAENPVLRGSTVGTSWMGRFVVAGGQDGRQGPPSYNDVHAYDPLTDTWEELPPMPTGRHGFGLVEWEGRMYAVAGAPQQGVSGFADLSVLEPIA